MLKITQKGNFTNITNFLKRAQKYKFEDLFKFGEAGVRALEMATPIDSGITATSWYYDVTVEDGKIVISFNNSNVSEGTFPVAIMLQYGHGTKNGGWVEGRDYINPAIQPIFDAIAEHAWEEVTRL